MKFAETPLPGAFVVEIEPHCDDRGYFTRTWCAREFAARIAANGPLAVRGIKRSVQDNEALPEKEALAVEFDIGIKVVMSEDAREGPKAFLEKRVPQYKGR